MLDDFIYRMSMVASSGLTLAEVPEAADSIKSQLSGGITSAILTFSREVHERDIQYMSYFDRSIAFIQYNEIIIVIEISSTVDRVLLDRFISFFKSETLDLVNALDPDTLSQGEAQLVLESFQKSDWLLSFLDDMGFQRPLSDTEHSILLVHHHDGGRISLESGENANYHQKIGKMIHDRNTLKKTIELYTCGFVMLNESNKAIFALSRNGAENSHVAMLEVDSSLISTLFRMGPLLIKNALKKLNEDENHSLDRVFDELKQIHDIDPTERVKDASYTQSLTYLETKVKKVDQLLFSIATGDQVVIVGAEDEVTQIIDLLLIFNQHLITDVFTYYQEGDRLSNDIIGMSIEDCERLRADGILNPDATIVELEKKSVKGKNTKSNKFLSNLFKRTKNLPITQAIDVIYRELELVVSYSVTATAYSVLSKSETFKALQSLKSSISDNDQYEIIQLLAAKQNKWLSSIIYDQSFDGDWI